MSPLLVLQQFHDVPLRRLVEHQLIMGTTHDVQCEEQYCLRWHDFQTNVTSAFSEIRDDEDLLDVTLVCPDGGMLRAHKLMLSACSPMFKVHTPVLDTGFYRFLPKLRPNVRRRYVT